MLKILITTATVADGVDVYPGKIITVQDKTAHLLIGCKFAREVSPAAAPEVAAPLFVKSNEDGSFRKAGKAFSGASR